MPKSRLDTWLGLILCPHFKCLDVKGRKPIPLGILNNSRRIHPVIEQWGNEMGGVRDREGSDCKCQRVFKCNTNTDRVAYSTTSTTLHKVQLLQKFHLSTIILLMERILHQLIGSLSHDLQGFMHPRWCRIPSSTVGFYILGVRQRMFPNFGSFRSLVCTKKAPPNWPQPSYRSTQFMRKKKRRVRMQGMINIRKPLPFKTKHPPPISHPTPRFSNDQSDIHSKVKPLNQ